VIRLRWLAAIVALAGVAAAAVASRDIGTAPVPAPADAWVGGYKIGGTPVVLELTLSADGQRQASR